MNNEAETNAELNNVVELKFNESNTQYDKSYFIVQRLAKQLAREARRNRLSYDQLRRVFVLCRKNVGLVPPKEKMKTLRIPTTDELNRFLSIQPANHRLIFSFMLGTGLRVFELVNARIEDLDITQNTLFVRDGKGGKSRVVCFGNKLKALIEIYLCDKKNQSYIFESLRNSKYSKRAIQGFADKYSKQANVKINCHLLRHTFCSRLAMASTGALGEAARATLMGHSKKSTSVLQARYTHASLEGIKTQAIAALDSYET